MIVAILTFEDAGMGDVFGPFDSREDAKKFAEQYVVDHGEDGLSFAVAEVGDPKDYVRGDHCMLCDADYEGVEPFPRKDSPALVKNVDYIDRFGDED